MDKYICAMCGYEYDEEKGIPEEGIAPGTKFEDIPDNFLCPSCDAKKKMFGKA